MDANKPAKTAAPKTEKSEKKETKATAVEKNSRDQAEKKPKWTVARCRKVARRFPSVEHWKGGAPSSFKSATAHGWVDEISRAVWSGDTHVPTKKAA